MSERRGFRIGTSEKGSLTLRMTVNVTPGHSSMPEKESAIGILANAVARYERCSVMRLQNNEANFTLKLIFRISNSLSRHLSIFPILHTQCCPRSGSSSFVRVQNGQRAAWCSGCLFALFFRRLEANPHPSMFGSGPERGTFEHLAPEVQIFCCAPLIWLCSQSAEDTEVCSLPRVEC